MNVNSLFLLRVWKAFPVWLNRKTLHCMSVARGEYGRRQKFTFPVLCTFQIYIPTLDKHFPIIVVQKSICAPEIFIQFISNKPHGTDKQRKSCFSLPSVFYCISVIYSVEGELLRWLFQFKLFARHSKVWESELISFLFGLHITKDIHTSLNH